MNKNNQKKNAGALIGAAFLMATSAIGPGFLTQTGKFTDSLHGSLYSAYPVCVDKTLQTKCFQDLAMW